VLIFASCDGWDEREQIGARWQALRSACSPYICTALVRLVGGVKDASCGGR
jgi:hypothetical protein